MPKRKERAAGYIRESDPNLADSATIDSQAKAVRTHCEKEGYDYTPDHEYREAISAYLIPYTQRPKLLELLASAKRGEFNVLVVSEIRALSRKQVEVFVIYDMLQKYGVRIETIQEKFEDSAIGRFILATRAMVAELERENTYMRTERGKRDRLENGAVNGHPKAAYGYVFVDTDREKKACYEFNHLVVYVDSEGIEWTEVEVALFIFDLARSGESLTGIASTLNKMGIPPPKKPYKSDPHWQVGTIHRILSNRMYIGEVWANKYKREKGKLKERPTEEQYLLPEETAPALIDKETFEAIQQQFEINKQEALRNNKHPEDLGILRAGYCFCGICGRRMHVVHHSPRANGKPRPPEYRCVQKSGVEGKRTNHSTVITQTILDHYAWEKCVEVIRNPTLVRERCKQVREENKPTIHIEDVEATIENVRKQMANLYKLAQNATNDETIDALTTMMKDLEKQKREAEALLYDIAEDDEERSEVEQEIVKFEQWVEKVQPLLTDPNYNPSYEEIRLAVRILGLKATVFPTIGDWPFRYQIDITIPAIVAKMKSYITYHTW